MNNIYVGQIRRWADTWADPRFTFKVVRIDQHWVFIKDIATNVDIPYLLNSVLLNSVPYVDFDKELLDL